MGDESVPLRKGASEVQSQSKRFDSRAHDTTAESRGFSPTGSDRVGWD
jgi:hypothetical protein